MRRTSTLVLLGLAATFVAGTSDALAVDRAKKGRVHIDDVRTVDRATLDRGPIPPAHRRAATGQSSRLIWDYRDTAPSKVSLVDYHVWLLDYCRSQTPERLVLYVSSPQIADQTFCDFYDPTAASRTGATDLNLVGFLATMSTESDLQGIEVELLADSSSFNPANDTPCGGWTPNPAAPTVGSITAPTLPSRGWGPCTGCAADRTAMGLLLDWFGTLAAQPDVAGGSLKGLVIDPESSRNPGGNDFYVQLAIWMDMSRTATASMRNMRLGLTVGVESHTFGKLVNTDFPVPASYNATSYPATYLGSDRRLTYRSSDASPLVDSVYLQVYDECIVKSGRLLPGSFYQWMCSGGADSGIAPTPIAPVAPWSTGAETAANILAATLRRRPEQPGPGTITATADAGVPNPVGGNPGGADLVGSGTRFTLWPPFARMQLVDGATRIPGSPASWNLMNAATSDISAQVNGLQASGGPFPYRYTELSIDYGAPTVVADQVDRFWFLFSAEKTTDTPFFGYWDYADFESFLTEFDATTRTAGNAPFVSASGGAILKPLQVGIYSLFEASRSWGADFYGTPYPKSTFLRGDLDEDGRVGGRDVGRILSMWGTGDLLADLNRDGLVDELDLESLFRSWGD